MKHWGRTFCILLAALLLSCSAALAVTPADWDSSKPAVLTADHLYSEAAALLDADTGELLLGKNESARVYPASTTKIMTLMLALESGIELDETITIPPEANAVPSDSSFVPVTVGEEMPFRDLLYGTMINSGNDGANSIAVLVSGSVEAFVAQMNQRAADLGCTNTHFANPHGYHSDDHYTSAVDMARIAAEAMKDPAFREIVAAKTYTMAATARRAAQVLTTKNALLNPDSDFYYEDAIGIKTGYHSKAGQCFVGAAERDGKTLIAVALNSDATQRNYKWRDAIRMLEYGYTRYTSYSLSELYARASYDFTSVVIPNAAQGDPQGGTLNLELVKLSNEDYSVMVRDVEGAIPQAVSEFTRQTHIELRNSLSAPIDAGEILGSLSYETPAGESITGVLIASRDVEARTETFGIQDVLPFLRVFNDPVVRWIGVILLVLLLLLALLAARRAAIRERRRQEIYRRRRREYERRVRRGDFDPELQRKRRKAAQRRRAQKRRDDFFD